jgi:hypothetical protein
MAKKNPSALDALRKAALAYPETREDHPWGEIAIKVKGKAFVFMGAHEDGRFGFSVKLPKSGPSVLKKKFAEPTHYGLGKSGWVTLTFSKASDVPMDRRELSRGRAEARAQRIPNSLRRR